MAITSCVKVHVWEHPSLLKPGHVALETHTGGRDDVATHISFWPPSGKCCAESKSHFSTYEHDKNYEEKESQTFTLLLSSERILKINKAFKEFTTDPYQWSPSGSSVFRRPYESNCAGLTLYLLEEGGLETGGLLNTKLSKLAIATLLSMAVFGGMSYLSHTHIKTLEKSSSEMVRALLKYHNLIDINRLCLNYISMVADRINDKLLTQILVNNERVGFTEEGRKLLQARDKINKLISSLPEDVRSNDVMHSWTNTLDSAEWSIKQVSIAKTTTVISTLVLSTMVTVFTQQVWIKTVTPSDVKKIVNKLELHQQAEKNTISRKFKGYTANIVGYVGKGLRGISLISNYLSIEPHIWLS